MAAEAIGSDVKQATIATLQYEIVAEYAHDIRAFTQGLEIRDGLLYESAGGYGHSTLSATPLRGPAPTTVRRAPAEVFLEGLTWIKDQLYVLTWREGAVFVLDSKLMPLGQLPLAGEGWGVTHYTAPDGERLLLSDGSDQLKVLEPSNLKLLRSIPVRADGAPLEQINELEFAHQQIYANLWHSDRIAVIDPGNGMVRAWLPLGDLKRRFAKPVSWREDEHVLNGIAYDEVSGHFFVTGKCWPKLFELKVSRVPASTARK